MSSLHRLNAIQNELREVLSISKSDIQLNAHELDIREEVRARFIGLQLSSVFQPIIDLRQSKPLGYEALLRAQNGKAQAVAPQEAFRQAEIAERLVKFDRLCRTLHTLNYLNMGIRDQLLFLNVHPDLLVAVNSHGKVFEQVFQPLHHGSRLLARTTVRLIHRQIIAGLLLPILGKHGVVVLIKLARHIV